MKRSVYFGFFGSSKWILGFAALLLGLSLPVFSEASEECLDRIEELGAEGLDQYIRSRVNTRTSLIRPGSSSLSSGYTLANDEPTSGQVGYVLTLKPALERMFAPAIVNAYRESLINQLHDYIEAWKKAAREVLGNKKKEHDAFRKSLMDQLQELRSSGRGDGPEAESLVRQLKKPQYLVSHDANSDRPITLLALQNQQAADAVWARFQSQRLSPYLKVLMAGMGSKGLNLSKVEKAYRYELSQLGIHDFGLSWSEVILSKLEEIRELALAQQALTAEFRVEVERIVVELREAIEEQMRVDLESVSHEQAESLIRQFNLFQRSTEHEVVKKLVEASFNKENRKKDKLSKTPPGERDFEEQVISMMGEFLFEEFRARVVATSEVLFEPVLTDYAAGQVSVRWGLTQSYTETRIIGPLRERLETLYPIGASAINQDSFVAKYRSFEIDLNPDAHRAQKNSEGKLELFLGPIGKAVYEPSVGTVVLYGPDRKKKTVLKDDKKLAQMKPEERDFLEKEAEFWSLVDHLPVIIKGHGEGTNHSNVASWQSLMARFLGGGFQPMAVSLPVSGPMPSVGLNSRGLLPTAASIRLYGELLPKVASHVPVFWVGRSAGSTKPVFQSAIDEAVHGRISPYAGYFLRSFSNPQTLDVQLANLQKQLDEGVIKTTVPEALDNFEALTRDGENLLKTLNKRNPKAKYQFGSNILFLQGNADEDGGPHAIEKLEAFRDEFVPLASIYTFESAFLDQKKYPFAYNEEGERDYSRFPPDIEEATHFLDSSQANISMKAFMTRFPESNIQPEDVPQLADQMDQVFGLQWAAMDLWERSPAAEISDFAKKRSEALRAYRMQQVAPVMGPEASFFDYFREWILPQFLRREISEEEWEATEPNRRGTLVERLKSVWHWANVEEPTRLRAIVSSISH